MKTKDPHLVKTPKDNVATEQLTTNDVVVDDIAGHEGGAKDSVVKNEVRDTTDQTVDSETIEHKGTVTLEDDVYDSKHVKDGDNPARQPDRRDQEGQTPFDGGVNADNPYVADEKPSEPKSEEITEENRYATLDNAQTRVLNTDEQENDVKRAKGIR